mmetsp:Transcript_18289/g.30494  ORF Transcript_18289/g.30494 Transcript_18289/m.30494 type:complete len:300 (+) Transcript_18289:454-1353(+)
MTLILLLVDDMFVDLTFWQKSFCLSGYQPNYVPRAFRLKLLLDTLPLIPLRNTLTHNRYQNDFCKSCFSSVETREHLFLCPTRRHHLLTLQHQLDTLFIDHFPSQRFQQPLSSRLRCFKFSQPTLMFPPPPHASSLTPAQVPTFLSPLHLLYGALPAHLEQLFHSWTLPAFACKRFLPKAFEHIATFVHQVVWHARNQDLKRWEHTHPLPPPPPGTPTSPTPPRQRHNGPRRQRLTRQRLLHLQISQPQLLCTSCNYPLDRHDPHTGCPRLPLTHAQLPLVYAEYLRTNTTPFARLGVG